jgi:hypothetical protein
VLGAGFINDCEATAIDGNHSGRASVSVLGAVLRAWATLGSAWADPDVVLIKTISALHIYPVTRRSTSTGQ